MRLVFLILSFNIIYIYIVGECYKDNYYSKFVLNNMFVLLSTSMMSCTYMYSPVIHCVNHKDS